jgi:hypothetical protein
MPMDSLYHEQTQHQPQSDSNESGVAPIVVCLFIVLSMPAYAEADAVELLQEYLHIDTANPLGNEVRAVESLDRVVY